MVPPTIVLVRQQKEEDWSRRGLRGAEVSQSFTRPTTTTHSRSAEESIHRVLEWCSMPPTSRSGRLSRPRPALESRALLRAELPYTRLQVSEWRSVAASDQLRTLWDSQRTHMNVPAASKSAVHRASVVGEELAILESRWREDDGGEGEIRSIGDLLSQGLSCSTVSENRVKTQEDSTRTSSESKRMPSTGLSSSSHSEAKTIKLPASSADSRETSRSASRLFASSASWQLGDNAELTTAREVDLIPPKSSTCPPQLRLCPARLALLSLRTRSDTQLRFRRARSDGAHAFPPFLPVAVGQGHAHEIVLGLSTCTSPALSHFRWSWLCCRHVKCRRDQPGQRCSFWC